jgi:SAM-dependent methyltransferase
MQIASRMKKLLSGTSTREEPVASPRHNAERPSGPNEMSDHLQKDMSVFFPNSANFWRYPALSYSAANKFPEQVLEILGAELGVPTPPELSAAEFSGKSDGQELDRRFQHHGSDKAAHGYAAIYSRILEQCRELPAPCILEIGLGTNDPKAISTMGQKGRPGASLRAFRDYMPTASVYGADIDPNTMFSEERIRTAVVDQLSPPSFADMTRELGVRKFDLIIDDGLHSTEANLNTLRFAFDALNPNGWLVIEDVAPRTVGAWRLVTALVNTPRLHCTLVKAKTQFLFVAQRLASTSI